MRLDIIWVFVRSKALKLSWRFLIWVHHLMLSLELWVCLSKTLRILSLLLRIGTDFITWSKDFNIRRSTDLFDCSALAVLHQSRLQIGRLSLLLCVRRLLHYHIHRVVWLIKYLVGFNRLNLLTLNDLSWHWWLTCLDWFMSWSYQFSIILALRLVRRYMRFGFWLRRKFRNSGYLILWRHRTTFTSKSNLSRCTFLCMLQIIIRVYKEVT